MTGIQDLPIEVVNAVSDHLTAGELAAFAQTSRKFFDIVDPILYRFAKTISPNLKDWHPLRWAALRGASGTLRKTLAAGIDPDIWFVDSYDYETRDMAAFNTRAEALNREGLTRSSPARGIYGEWPPQDDDSDEDVHQPRDPGRTDRTDEETDESSDDEIDFFYDMTGNQHLFLDQAEHLDHNTGDDEDDRSYASFSARRHLTEHLCVFRAIHLAALGGHDEVLQTLLDHGAKIDVLCSELCDCKLVTPRVFGSHHMSSTGRWGRTALHLAICHFQKSTARLLLARGASIWLSDPEAPTTALHLAALTGQTDLCQHLLDRGYAQDVDVLDNNKLSPFYYAFHNGHWDTTVPFLLEKGANLDIQIPYDQDSLDSSTILHESIQQGRFNDAIRLVHLGADVNKGSFSDGQLEETPLHAASRPSRWSHLEAPRDPPLKLSSPVEEEHLRMELIHELLQAGADIDARTSDSVTPLHCAAMHKFAPAVETLLSAEANVHIRDMRGQTALWYACLPPWSVSGTYASDLDEPEDPVEELHLIGFLLDHGSRVDARDYQGDTVLHSICQSDERHDHFTRKLAQITRLLLDRGAMKSARCDLRKSPFRLAFESGKYTICDILVRRRKTVLGLHPEELHEMLAFSIQNRPRVSQAFDLLYDLDSQDSLWESSAHVMQMIRAGHYQLAWAYLQRKLPPLSRSEKFTILHAAVLDGRIDIMKQLLAIKAPVNILDQDGVTPLYRLLDGPVAEEDDVYPLVRDFLAAGAGPYQDNGSSPYLTPMEKAIRLKLTSVVEILLHHSPLRDDTSAPKGVYLHAAAGCSHPSERIINMLIHAGAELTEIDELGNTALDVFLQRVIREPYRNRYEPERRDVICMTIWHLWSKDIDITRKNSEERCILSYLTELRTYDKSDVEPNLVAMGLQRRIHIVPLPGKKTGKTLKFSPWFTRLDIGAAKKSELGQNCS